MTSDCDRVGVIIVGFRNADEVRQCIAALARSTVDNFDIFVCENGGRAHFRELCKALIGSNLVLRQGFDQNISPSSSQPIDKTQFGDLVSYRLRETGISLFILEAIENLGYAGAVNAWLRRLLKQPEYAGFWILNPDTQVEPDAFFELVKYVHSSRKGMVGCQIRSAHDPHLIQSRGLQWRPFLASTKAVDYHASASQYPDLKAIEKSLDAPSGASFYVTRECVEQIGLMDERYFLFFEDLDWGLRAKKLCCLGYAHSAIVRHQGGTTLGSVAARGEKSKLSVFLEFRNRLLFVRRRYPAWFAWTILVLLLRALEYAAAGSVQNTITAYRGIVAGVAGQIGRPDLLIERHVATRVHLTT